MSAARRRRPRLWPCSPQTRGSGAAAPRLRRRWAGRVSSAAPGCCLRCLRGATRAARPSASTAVACWHGMSCWISSLASAPFTFTKKGAASQVEPSLRCHRLRFCVAFLLLLPLRKAFPSFQGRRRPFGTVCWRRMKCNCDGKRSTTREDKRGARKNARPSGAASVRRVRS